MKSIFTYYITTIVILWAAFSSCSKSLDVRPTVPVESEFFESEYNVQQAIGGCYAGFANIYSAQLDAMTDINPGAYLGAPQFWMLPGDDITNRDGSNADLEAFSGLNTNNGRVAAVWGRYYQIIFRTNFILEKLELPEIQVLYKRQGLLNANKGEALFIRSWAFYRLWDWFRKAPIQNKRIAAIDASRLPPSKGFAMLDTAIADLEKAVALLPDASFWNAGTEKGRVWNESAYGALVKCYVLRARYNNKSTDDYNKAIAAFQKITTRTLVKFPENFDYRFQNNSESLFEYQAGHAVRQDNAWLDNNFGDNAGQMGVFYHYFTNYWANYNSGIYGPTQKLIMSFEAGDPRLEQTASKTVFTNVYGDLDEPSGPVWDYFDGYQFQKYVRPGRCIFEPTWKINSMNNYRMMRYADIKLLAAEAYLNTGNTNEALKQVNDIRARARASTEDGSTASVPANLPSITMKNIIDERYRELAGEDGIRWSDLRSWHAAGFIDLSKWTIADFGYELPAANFEFKVPKHLLFPIPQSEMDANPLMLADGNNPGY